MSKEQVIDWFGQRKELFRATGYTPSDEIENQMRFYDFNYINILKSTGAYHNSRKTESIGRLYGIGTSKQSAFFKELLEGRSFADLCCGMSAMALSAIDFGAISSMAIDIDSESREFQKTLELPTKNLDIGEKVQNRTRLPKFDVTFNTYGLPFWASSVEQAHNSVANQSFMTRFCMLNGPIVEVRTTSKINPLEHWDELSDLSKYRYYVEFAGVKAAIELEEQGFDVNFVECLGNPLIGSGSHSLVAVRN